MNAPTYIDVNIHNNTGRKMYVAIQRSELNRKDPWLYPVIDSIPSWGHFDKEKCNLPLSGSRITKIKYPNDLGSSATMYITTRQLTGTPDFKSALFIYDQIEIVNDSVEVIRDGVEINLPGKWTLSNIDFFGLPMQIASGGEKVGFNDNVIRKDIMNSLSELVKPFNTYRIPNPCATTCTDIYRWFAPSKKDPGNIWRQAIRDGLKRLKGQSFLYKTNDGTTRCTFRRAGYDSIVVKEIDRNRAGKIGRDFQLNNIDTIGAIRGTLFPEVVKVDWVEKGSGDEMENVRDQTIKSGALIAAAINRGVLYDTKLWDQRSHDNGEEADWRPKRNYYQSSPDNHGQYNYYAKVLHDHSLNHKCFGFCYDDYFLQASVLKVDGITSCGTSVDITLLPF